MGAYFERIISSGDRSMAYNMQVAFATTVVGLVVSAIGFVTMQIKQGWYLQDLTSLEFLAEVLNEDFTMVKNPGKENMEIITKEGNKINRYTPSKDQNQSGNRGRRVGVAYELENGEIIYVPE